MLTCQPEIAILRKVCLHSWSSASTMTVQEGSHNSNCYGSLCLSLSADDMVYAEYLLSYWESRLLVQIRQRCLHKNPNPIKTLGTKSLISFHSPQHFTSVVTIRCWRNEGCAVSLCWAKTLRSLHLVSSRLCTTCLFPLPTSLCVLSQLLRQSRGNEC